MIVWLFSVLSDSRNFRQSDSFSSRISRLPAHLEKTLKRCSFVFRVESFKSGAALEYGLEIFGGKWKSRIICVLAEMKTLRYSELRKEMSNITDAVLASTLKELIRDKIVERKSFDEIPPHVEYSLSEKGLSVVPILQNICKWSGIFYNEDNDNTFTQCQKCNYRS